MRHLFILIAALWAVLWVIPAGADQSPFPYPVVEVAGVDALEEWQRLRLSDGTPVILGDLRTYEGYFESFSPEMADIYPDTVQDILNAAEGLTHPEALYDHRRAEQTMTINWPRERGDDEAADRMAARDPAFVPEELIGRVPLMYSPAQRPLGYLDYRTNEPVETVFIAILPTENPWEAPAYLRWGGWNANPPPEVHMTALKHYYEEYGAVPLVMTSDVMELYAPQRPTDIEDAIALAREHFLLCEDIVYQGLGDIGTLAADRMRTPYWYFWWD